MWHHLDIADIERALRKVTMLHKVITSSPFMIIVIFWDCYFHVMWQPAVLLIEIVYALEWVLKMLEKFTLWTNGGGQKKNSFPEKVFTCQSPAWPITQVNLNILMCHHFDFGCHLRKSMVPQMLRRHRSITPSNQPNLITCVTLMMIMRWWCWYPEPFPSWSPPPPPSPPFASPGDQIIILPKCNVVQIWSPKLSLSVSNYDHNS